MKRITTKETCILLASNDFALSQTDFTPWENTYIFANHCILSTAKIKSKNIQLHTSSFLVKNEDAIIEAAGADGEDNKHEGSKTANGHAGFNIFFSSARWHPDKPMSFSVRGGDGRSGWPGLAYGKKGGKGGDGGPGGSAFLLYSDNFRLVHDATGGWFTEEDEKKKRDKVADWIEYCKTMITFPQSLVDAIARFSDNYPKMPANEARKKLLDLAAAIGSASVAFGNKVRVNYAGGAYGHGGSGTPEDGENGARGSIGSSKTETMSNEIVRNVTHIIFHPDQIAMTLRDIENDYFLGSPDSVIIGCARSLRTLIDRLSVFSSLKPTDPLFQAYQEQESKLFILGSGKDTPSSITSINKTLAKARSYLRQISSGLDFYGNAPAWVPRGSFDFYKAQLEEVLDGFADIELNYSAFQLEATSQAKKRDIIAHSVQKATTSIGRARHEIAQLTNEMDAVSLMIHGFPTDFKAKRERLSRAIEEAGKKIEQHKFGISLLDFLAVAAQFAFNPGLSAGVTEAVKVIGSEMTEVEDDDGVKVNKAYLVKKIKAINGTIEGLKEGLTVGPGGDELTIDDPGAAKLLVEERSLLELIGKFRGLLDDYTVSKIRSMFDDYVNTVLRRNNYVIRYNIVFTLIVQAHKVIDAQQHQLDLLARETIEKIDLELPALAVFIEQAFFDAAARVLKMLYRAERALAFWTLAAPVGNLSALRRGGFIRSDHGVNSLYSAFVSARNSIITAYADAIENSTHHTQKFGETVPIKVYLSQEDVSNLQKGVYVTITPARSTTPKKDNPFADCADVRLSRVRFYVKGAKTSDNMLDVSLKHLGNETMIDVRNGMHVFVHNDINFKFQYNLKTGAIQTDGDMTSLVNNELALPGPFAQWRITVNKHYNKDLDMSEATEAWFEFAGRCRTFG